MIRCNFNAIIAVLIISANGFCQILPNEFQIACPSLRGRCFEVLFEGIDSGNPINAAHSAEALTMVWQKSFVEHKLSASLKLEIDDRMKCCIARELVRAGFDEHTEVLIDTLKSPNSNAYAHAAEGIYKADIKVDVSALKNALKITSSPLDRLWIYAAMLKNNTQGLQQIKQMLHGDDLLISSVAALILGQTGNLSNEDIDYLTANIDEFSPIQTAIIYSGLWDYAKQRSEDALLRLTYSSQSSVRAFAAYSLRNSLSTETICILLRLIDDEDEDVRIRAAHALLSIRAKIDKQLRSFSDIKLDISEQCVNRGQKISVRAECATGKLQNCIIATPYTIASESELPGFNFNDKLKWSWLTGKNGRFEICTDDFQPGIYNLSLIGIKVESYLYRDFSIKVKEPNPSLETIILSDNAITNTRSGLGNFLQLEDSSLLAGSYISKDNGYTWSKSDVGFGYIVCRLGNGNIMSFSGHIKPLDEGRFAVRTNIYNNQLKQIDSFNAIINLPQFRPGIAHKYYDAPLPMRSLIELKDGSLLCSMYGRFDGDDEPWRWNTGDPRAKKMRMFVIKSEDKGRSWSYLSTVGIDTEGITMEGFDESVVGYIPDGRLMALMRSGDNAHSGWEDNFIYSSFSSDDGKSWSKPKSIGVQGVAPDFCVMADGTIACSYGRPGVKLIFSTDNGNTWGNSVSIDSERYRGYTAICEVAADTLLVGYRVKDALCEETGRRIPDQLRMAIVKKSNVHLSD